MMKTTTLRRQEGGTSAASGMVPRAKRTRAASEGAAMKQDEETRRLGDLERAIWAQTEKPLSDDRRFLLTGQWVRVISQCEDGRYQGRDGWLKAWQATRVVVEIPSFGGESVLLSLAEDEVEMLPPLPANEVVMLASRCGLNYAMAHSSRVSAKNKVALMRRYERLKHEIGLLHRLEWNLTKLSAWHKLGIQSNHVTAIVPWTGGAAKP